MHDYSCKNDVLETKKGDSPMKDEAPGNGSFGKNRNIFIILARTTRKYERVL